MTRFRDPLGPARPESTESTREFEKIAESIPPIPTEFRQLRDLLTRIREPMAPVLKFARDTDIPTASGVGGATAEQLSLVSDVPIGGASGSILGIIPQAFYGQTNLLRDPTFENIATTPVAVTLGGLEVGLEYIAEYDIVSGAAPTAVDFNTRYARGQSDDNPMNSAVASVGVDFPVGASTITVKLMSSQAITPTTVPLLAYLIAGVKFKNEGLPGDVAVTATMHVTDSAYNPIQSSLPISVGAIASDEVKALWAALPGPDSLSDYAWRLDLTFVHSAGAISSAEVLFGEPLMQFTATESLPPFAPILGSWMPDRLESYQSSTFVELITSRIHTENFFRYSMEASGEMNWGGGSAAADIILSRGTGGNGLRLTASTNPAYLELEGSAGTPPGNADPGHGRLWWNTSTGSFWQTNESGVDTDLAAGGGSATQVSRDATAGSSDYVARIRLGTDTTYRAFLGLEGADRGSLEFGPGGVAARDLRLMRAGTSQLSIDSISSGSATQVTIIATAGQQSVFNMQVAGDTFVRTTLRGDATTAGLSLGSGSAAPDLRVQRQTYASKVLWDFADDAGSIGAAMMVTAAGSGTTTSAHYGVRVSGDTGYRGRLTNSVDGSTATPGLVLGSGSADDIRLWRTGAGGLRLNSAGTANSTVLTVESTSGQSNQISMIVSGDTNSRVILRGDATTTGIHFGPGNAGTDWNLLRVAADEAQIGSGDLLNLDQGHLTIPTNNTGSSVLGRFRWSTSTTVGQRIFVYDSQRDRDVMPLGWNPYAYPINFVADAAFSTAAVLPISGGSIAIPIIVPSSMLVQSLTHRVTAASGTAEARLYRQRLNNGNAGENTLDEVPGCSVTIAAAGAAATVTTNVGTPGTYIGPGLYWLVIRCTSGATTFSLGSTAASTNFAVNSAQTKTLGSALASTLDFVAATWTKVTAIYAVRLNGRVFGQTAAF